MRYDELVQRMLLRTEKPGVLFKQVQELDRAIYAERQKEKHLALLEYKQLQRRIPALLSAVVVQLAQRDLD